MERNISLPLGAIFLVGVLSISLPAYPAEVRLHPSKLSAAKNQGAICSVSKAVMEPWSPKFEQNMEWIARYLREASQRSNVQSTPETLEKFIKNREVRGYCEASDETIPVGYLYYLADAISDAFLALRHVRDGGDVAVVEQWADVRAVGALVGHGPKGNRSWKYTTPVLDAVVALAKSDSSIVKGPQLKEDPMDLPQNYEAYNTAVRLAYEHGLSAREFISMYRAMPEVSLA